MRLLELGDTVRISAGGTERIVRVTYFDYDYFEDDKWVLLEQPTISQIVGWTDEGELVTWKKNRDGGGLTW